MKKLSVGVLVFLFLPALAFSQEEIPEETAAEEVSSEAVLSEESQELVEPGKPMIPLYSLFHMYMEYGTGELAAPIGKRALEQLDVKMTYNQNFDKVRWISLGFIGQISWNFGEVRFKELLDPANQGKDVPIEKLILPTNMELSATLGFFNNIFTIGVGSSGTISPTLYYNGKLPDIPGIHSHDWTLLVAPVFSVLGNQYKNGKLQNGWFDKLEMRLAYRMKFTSWFGIRPEVLFNFSGKDLIAGKTALEAFTFRANPRIQFYYGDFSFFIEPRFFWFGDTSYFKSFAGGTNFQWEIKIGFDITKLVIR